jgi:hypothetical protein
MERRLRIAAVVVVAFPVLASVARAQDISVFVSSQTMNGNLGGLSGADSVCESLGTTAFPGSGPWVAWLSDSTTNAVDRIPIPDPDGAYVRATQPNTIISDDLGDLTDASLSAPILLDENGATPPVNPLTGRATTWTGTSTAGTAVANNCVNWTSSEAGDLGLGGASELSDHNWTLQVTAGCNLEFHLYCFGDLFSPIFINGFESDGR